jgi:hypothetical protein
MASSSVRDIDNKFLERMVRPDKINGRPINPFATTSSKTAETSFREALLKPEITTTSKLGSIYNGKVVDAKFPEAVSFDTYTVHTNPKAGYKLHSTRRMEVEHTREK